MKRKIPLFEYSSPLRKNKGGAWAVLVGLAFSLQQAEMGQVLLALHGCPKEANGSGRLEPGPAKPEGRASHCFPGAGLGRGPD